MTFIATHEYELNQDHYPIGYTIQQCIDDDVQDIYDDPCYLLDFDNVL